MKITLLLIVFLFPIYLVAQSVTPLFSDSIYTLTFQNIDFNVDANNGAKVSSLLVDGKEVLVTSEESPGYLWGSSLWPAPQTEMGWPPPMQIADGQYQAFIQGNKMRFESIIDTDNLGNKMQINKTYWANSADTSISIEYTLVNKSNTAITKSLWELTRVPVNGISFWPTGTAGTWGELSDAAQTIFQYTWVDISAEARSGIKLFADGADGWFAHIDTANRLLIKKFVDIDLPDFAEDEGEIELYIGDKYIELENLSAAQTLQPNDSMQYQVKWYLRQMPNDIDYQVGDDELIAYVNSIINASTVTNTFLDNSKLELYPNPSNGIIHLTGNNVINQVNVYDLCGALIYSNNSNTCQVTVNLSQHKNGLYIVEIFTQGKKEIFKICLTK